MILQYVQIESNVALIDTRVYCRDIIEVDHGNWYRDTLLPHQALVESKFGLIRFQTGSVKEPGARGTKYVKYALLTEAQCNALLVFSRNIGRVAEKKLELIAEFEAAKQQIRNFLERSLNQEPDLEKVAMAARIMELEAMLKSEQTKAAFPYTLEELHEISRIVIKQQVRDAVKESFAADTDYVVINKKMLLSESTFNILVLSFRSLKGTDIARLPAIIKIEAEKYFQYQSKKRKNTRVGQAECPGQLKIPGSDIW